MRELRTIGLDADGEHIICETVDDDNESGERFRLRDDEQLRAALRGETDKVDQPPLDFEVSTMLRPRDIQSRIRAGASVEQVAAATGGEISRVERFAHPVLLERSRAAELATAAHPVLADGPAVLTLLEVVTTALVARGLNPDHSNWDAWRNEDGRWTVQLAWKAGRSDNIAHFRFVPGAHGGTVTAVDDAASELINPDFDRPLRPVAPVAQLDFDKTAPPAAADAAPVAEAAPTPARNRRGKPPVPAWEDVLLGVRSAGQR
jgi:hypothetical protein